jgi:hypothetical protein
MKLSKLVLLTVTLSTLTLSAPASAEIGTLENVPVPVPERPFLLVDAERRYLPNEPAHVRVQLRQGGRLRVSLFRVTNPEDLLGQAGRRQGVSVSRTPIGREAEALVRAGDPHRTQKLPRRGSSKRLTLLRDE